LPASAWADSLATAAGPGGTVALLAAAGYMEDQQIVAYLARHLIDRGLRAHLCCPPQLRWQAGRAYVQSPRFRGAVDLIVRFYQGEWLSTLAASTGWVHLFCGRTMVANPGSALLVESKRFPLTWNDLKVGLPTWRRILPEPRDPHTVRVKDADQWVLKAAFCNNGDEVAIRHALPPGQWRKALWSARLNPGRWVAQQRFEPVPVLTPIGAVHPCLGVYVIDGRAAGIYGRITRGHIVDYSAIDAAVLIEKEHG